MPLMFAGWLISQATVVSSVLLTARTLWALYGQRRDFRLWAQELKVKEQV